MAYMNQCMLAWSLSLLQTLFACGVGVTVVTALVSLPVVVAYTMLAEQIFERL